MSDYLIKLLLVIITLLTPIHALLITVGILIFTDLVSGIWAAKKRNENISSAALRRTVSKMLIYQTVIITGFLLEQYLLSGAIPVSKMCSAVIGLVEFKSILENADTIYGESIFKNVIKKLGSDNDKPEIK